MKAGDFQQNLAALSQDGRVNPLCPFTKDYHTSVCLSRLRSSEFLVQYFPSYKRLELRYWPGPGSFTVLGVLYQIDRNFTSSLKRYKPLETVAIWPHHPGRAGEKHITHVPTIGSTPYTTIIIFIFSFGFYLCFSTFSFFSQLSLISFNHRGIIYFYVLNRFITR